MMKYLKAVGFIAAYFGGCEIVGYLAGRIAADKKEEDRLCIAAIVGFLLSATSIPAAKKLQRILDK